MIEDDINEQGFSQGSTESEDGVGSGLDEPESNKGDNESEDQINPDDSEPHYENSASDPLYPGASLQLVSP